MVTAVRPTIKANIPMLVTEKEKALLELMRETGYGIFDTLSFESGQPIGAKRLLENIKF